MQKTYFEKGLLKVTNQFVSGRGRSIQLATIESVDLSRGALLSGGAIAAGFVLLTVTSLDLLHFHEALLFILLAALAVVGALFTGSLTVFSKLTGDKGWTVYGSLGTLRQMREAIEKALSDRDYRLSGGAATDDDETE
jgi:hypothetical protein